MGISAWYEANPFAPFCEAAPGSNPAIVHCGIIRITSCIIIAREVFGNAIPEGGFHS